MDDVLALTIIPNLEEQQKQDNIASGSTAYNPYDPKEEESLLLWFNNIGTGKKGNRGQTTAKSALQAYNTLRSYVANAANISPYDGLVNEFQLKGLGLNPEFVGSFLKNQTSTSKQPNVRTTAYLAVFLQLLGVTGSVAVETVMHCFDASYKKTHLKIVDSSQKMHGWDSYMDANADITAEELRHICSTSLTAHLNTKEVTAVVNEARDDVALQVKDALNIPVFSAENILSEVFYQIIEPAYARCLFRKLTAASVHVDPQRFKHTRCLSKHLRGKNVQLLGPRQPFLANELFNVLLPRRFHIRNGMTIAMMDAYLDVLLGVTVELKQIMYNIVSFTCVQGLVIQMIF